MRKAILRLVTVLGMMLAVCVGFSSPNGQVSYDSARTVDGPTIGAIQIKFEVITTAQAQVGPPPVCPPICPPPPPPPPPPTPSTPDTSNYGGHRGKIDIRKAIANGAVCTIGGIVIDRVSVVTPTLLQKFSNTIVCNGVALIVAGPPGLGGFFGIVATQTICCGSQSIVVKTLRPGGWKCQPGDLVDGCAQWLKDHPVPKPKKIKRFRKQKLTS